MLWAREVIGRREAPRRTRLVRVGSMIADEEREPGVWYVRAGLFGERVCDGEEAPCCCSDRGGQLCCSIFQSVAAL